MVEDLFRPPRDEDGIPVLTEVMNAPTFSGASTNANAESTPPQTAAAKLLPTKAAAMAYGVPPVMEREIGAPLNNPQAAAPEPNFNETQLREAVLSRVLPRIEAVLEHRLNETTREVLEQVMPLLREELQNALTATAKDVISRAINQEIAKLGRV